MNKQYQVFYIIKKNGRNILNHMFVRANNKNEAFRTVREVVRQKSGRHAFGCSTNVEHIAWKCDMR